MVAAIPPEAALPRTTPLSVNNEVALNVRLPAFSVRDEVGTDAKNLPAFSCKDSTRAAIAAGERS